MSSQEGERITDDRFESGSTDRSVRRCDDALRFLPFLVFGGKKEVPGYITYLSGVLPYAIMGMLVVYCLKNMNLFAGTHGIPEILASAAVVGLHVWKRNTLLSIAVGTVFYMFPGPGGILNDRILLVR